MKIPILDVRKYVFPKRGREENLQMSDDENEKWSPSRWRTRHHFWCSRACVDFWPQEASLAVLLRDCLAKIVAPITDVIALISGFRARPNDILITDKYKECKSSNPSVSSPCFRFSRMSKRIWGLYWRNSATVAQIKIPTARRTRLPRPFAIYLHGIESRLEKCTDVIRSTIFWLNITARGNIDIGANGVRESLGDAALWSAGN